MNEQSNSPHSAITAKELVQELILQATRGETISVKETIAAVRRDGPHLLDTDDALVELIVDMAPAFGLSVEFDLHG